MAKPVSKSTNIPIAFKKTRLTDYDVTRRKGARSVLRQIDEWDPTISHPALLLEGPPGVGKTMLVSALLNEYHAQFSMDKAPKKFREELLQKKFPVYFIQLAEFIALQIRAFNLHDLVMKGHTDATEYLELDNLLQNLYKVNVLVIDDVGKEHHTGSNFAQDSFDLLVRTRHNEGLATLYTTNIPLYKWSYQYSESMQSLIERSSHVITF